MLYEPKIDEKNKKYVIDLSEVSKKFKISSSSRNNIINEENSLFDSQKTKKPIKNKSNPPNSKILKNSPMKNIDNNSLDNSNKIKTRKSKRIKSKIKRNEINSNIQIKMYEENNKEEKNSIEYNELTYAQALEKDERNILQIFFSYFNDKIDLVQIFFYPK